MKYFLILVVFAFFGCNAQFSDSGENRLSFEEVNHYNFQLISKKFEVIETQDKMDSLFSKIHQNSGGQRLAPVPQIMPDETYLIFKPVLKSSNDILIKEIQLQNNNLLISTEDFNNPQLQKASRISPNILIKILKKVSIKKVLIENQKNKPI